MLFRLSDVSAHSQKTPVGDPLHNLGSELRDVEAMEVCNLTQFIVTVWPALVHTFVALSDRLLLRLFLFNFLILTVVLASGRQASFLSLPLLLLKGLLLFELDPQ